MSEDEEHGLPRTRSHAASKSHALWLARSLPANRTASAATRTGFHPARTGSWLWLSPRPSPQPQDGSHAHSRRGVGGIMCRGRDHGTSLHLRQAPKPAAWEPAARGFWYTSISTVTSPWPALGPHPP